MHRAFADGLVDDIKAIKVDVRSTRQRTANREHGSIRSEQIAKILRTLTWHQGIDEERIVARGTRIDFLVLGGFTQER